ncbi:hypothetical protein [Nocardia sp. NPDC050710]|uniref:hypothetical protein n=1 Tax=Nocardia sp. NPDC050710 TaxID=3157220 RepID=UPI0033CB4AB2
MNADEVPQLLPPKQAPPVRTPEDLRLLWSARMANYAFTHRSLWCLFLAPDGRSVPVLPTIEPLPTWPDSVDLLNVMRICTETLSACAPDGSVGFLLARPGPCELRVSDRAWHHGLRDTAAQTGLHIQPIHLATDEELRTLADEEPLHGHERR